MTGFAPNKLCYGFKVNNNVTLLEDLPTEDYNRLRQIKREAAEEAIAFANTVTKVRYDKVHTAMHLKQGDMVYLKLYHGYKIPGLANRKLSQQRVGPFRILAKVGNLAYKLDLPPTMSIHPVISIAQLEPKVSGDDPYKRPRDDNNQPAVENQDDSYPSFEIESLLDKRITRGIPQYLVKWKGWDHSWNTWYKVEDLAEAGELVQECEARLAKQPGKPARVRRSKA